MKIASVIILLITMALAWFEFTHSERRSPAFVATAAAQSTEVESALKDFQERAIETPSSNLTAEDKARLRKESINLHDRISQASRARPTSTPAVQSASPDTLFWLKLGFSVVLGLAALMIILSRRYDDKTQSWAFSMLTLISGVWVGTVS